MKDKREELLNGGILSVMFKLGIPGIIGMFIISLYSFVDAAFVGRFAPNGKLALGAIGTAYAFTLINNGIACLIGVGSASVLSRAIGRRDEKVINAVMDNCLILSVGLSLIPTILGYIVAPFLFTLIKLEGEMHTLATQYLRIVFLGSVFVNFGQASNMVLRGEGKLITAMVIMCFGAVLNIVLDAFFVVYLGRGLEGAAIATVISQAAFAVISFVYILRSKDVTFNKYRLEKSIVGETFAIGVSAMLMQVLSLVQQAVMYSTLKKYGGEGDVILMGGFFRYFILTFVPLWGLSQGFQPFIGTNFGAGRIDRVKKGTFCFWAFGLLMSFIGYIYFFASPEGVLSIFITDSSLVAQGKLNAMLAYSIFPIESLLILNITLFQSLGKAKPAGILAIGRQFLFFLPVCIILPIFIGVKGVWLAIPIVDGFVFLISLIFVFKIFSSLKSKAPASSKPTVNS